MTHTNTSLSPPTLTSSTTIFLPPAIPARTRNPCTSILARPTCHLATATALASLYHAVASCQCPSQPCKHPTATTEVFLATSPGALSRPSSSSTLSSISPSSSSGSGTATSLTSPGATATESHSSHPIAHSNVTSLMSPCPCSASLHGGNAAAGTKYHEALNTTAGTGSRACAAHVPSREVEEHKVAVRRRRHVRAKPALHGCWRAEVDRAVVRWRCCATRRWRWSAWHPRTHCDGTRGRVDCTERAPAAENARHLLFS
ncbi:hypothetical protein M427DRAFT_319821 [Gonapodya prolifera JEL478]|uniref:Uncharacterized protein n=1 Tax=Gonapodya prolifera (strain JEL478) TaxID=1344416 RepID=A0A139AFQ4_GONPJ|nr:hypothetical protein M427DRAFT_319821 [Gonapodya prolifera JEL478]|eukprot:KXS15652.1 hypothetical protein M427DRAFT_319821 [Gonapodya prolifera JEL478]